MTQDLADWRRPHYAPGARPLLFYAVFGAPANGRGCVKTPVRN
jgi:hypothetical protein